MQIPNPSTDPEKRQAILDACFEQFAAKGFAGTDVEQVAHLANVGKGTVYRYFGNKEELFRATADSAMKRLETHILGVLEGIEDPVEIIRTAAVAYAEFFQRHPQLVESLTIERAEFRDSIPATHLVYREKNRRIIDDILRRGMALGEFRHVNVREATNALANMLYGTVVCGCLEGSSRRLKRRTEHCIDLYLNGILTRGGAGKKRS